MNEMLMSLRSNFEEMKQYLRLGIREPKEDDLVSVYLPALEMEVYVFADFTANRLMPPATANIFTKLVEEWKVDPATVIDTATKNTLNHSKVTTMAEVLGVDSGIPMYVITSDTGVKGAASFMYYDLLNDLCDKLESDRIVILPSSIHEVIVVAEDVANTDLVQMITEINQTEVEPQDRLCNFPFEYRKSTGVLRKT